MAAIVGPPVAGKKQRKPYTITRPRERWSGEEHDRFLHALQLHAQKYFLKARKFGLAGGLPPLLHPRRAAPLPDMMPPWLPSDVALPPPPAGGCALPAALSSIGCRAPPSAVQQSMADWSWSPACYSREDSFRPLIRGDDCSFIEAPNCRGSGEACLADAAFLQDETILLPISPDDLGFAQVYKFVGDVFGSGEPRPVEAQLRRLQGMDPAISETILLVLKNLEANLSF